MFKAWADINDHNDSKGINEVFKFFMQQFSEHDKQLFLEHFKTMGKVDMLAPYKNPNSLIK